MDINVGDKVTVAIYNYVDTIHLFRYTGIVTKFGTNYTTSEIFWAGETVKEIIEGEKLRIKVGE